MAEGGKRAFCCTNSTALCFWFAAFLVLAGIGLLLRELIPALHPHHAAILFGAAGVACLVNFARNRTFHCAITGPLFLLVAGYLVLATTAGWAVNDGLLWAVVLIVVGAVMLIERRFAQ